MACGAIPNPEMPFNSEATRYEQRFGSFAFMQRPMPLLYDQYIAAMDVTGASLILTCLQLHAWPVCFCKMCNRSISDSCLSVLSAAACFDRTPVGNDAVRQAQMVTCQVLSTALICIIS